MPAGSGQLGLQSRELVVRNCCSWIYLELWSFFCDMYCLIKTVYLQVFCWPIFCFAPVTLVIISLGKTYFLDMTKIRITSLLWFSKPGHSFFPWHLTPAMSETRRCSFWYVRCSHQSWRERAYSTITSVFGIPSFTIEPTIAWTDGNVARESQHNTVNISYNSSLL